MSSIFEKKNWYVFAGYFLLSLVLFHKTIFLGFFSDDYHFLSVVFHTTDVARFFFLNNVGGDFGGSYGPVLVILWFLQYSFFGLAGWMYHVVLLAAYATTAFIVQKIAKICSGQVRVGVLAGVFFLLAQNHTSALAWVAVMPHVWATVFFVAALYGYLRYLRNEKGWWYVFALLMMVISLFTKESALLFPCVFFCADLCFSSVKGVFKRLVLATKRSVPFVFLVLIYLCIRHTIVGYVFGYYGSASGSVLSKAFTGLFPLLSSYARMFTEITLSMFFGSPYRQKLLHFFTENLFWVLTIGFFSGVLVLTYLDKKTRRLCIFFSTSYVFITAPFVMLLFDQLSDSGERYGYISSVFFCVLFALLLEQVFRYRYFFAYLLTGCCLFWLFLQHTNKLLVWEQSASIREQIIFDMKYAAISPKDYVLFIGLPDNVAGVELLRNGVFEMVALETDLGQVHGERVPLYVEPKKFEKKTAIVELVALGENNFLLGAKESGEHRYFTGFPKFRSDLGYFSLENFRHIDHSGTAIRFSLEGFDTLPDYDRVVIAYYNGARLVLHPIALH